MVLGRPKMRSGHSREGFLRSALSCYGSVTLRCVACKQQAQNRKEAHERFRHKLVGPSQKPDFGELIESEAGETTIKIKFAVLGGGHWGQRGKSSKTLLFVGNATTINFESVNFIVEKFCCHCAGSYRVLQKGAAQRRQKLTSFLWFYGPFFHATNEPFAP